MINQNALRRNTGLYVHHRLASRTTIVEAIGRDPNKTIHTALIKPTGTHHKSGAIKNKPQPVKPFRRIGAMILVCIFMYCGGQLSSLGARLLHEYDIFELPNDDEF